ncbi:MAG: hypothetical protein J5798_02165 [Spirochaetaceae bacterium]|nr:hypothetical protein [Spirochaetaceae bacterium]
MKKCIILSAICMLIILAGCTKDNGNVAEELQNQIEELQNQIEELQNKIEELQNKNAELVKENEELALNNRNLTAKIETYEKQIQELSEHNAELEENLELYSTDIETRAKIIVHKLDTVLNFEDVTSDLPEIYKFPLSDEVIYTVQTNDKINVKSFIEYGTKNYIKVILPNNSTGYIKCKYNPYANGNFTPIENLTVDNKQVTILKMDDSFCDFGYPNLNLKALPSETSENVCELGSVSDSVKSIAITADYKWVKIQFNEYEGWIPAGKLGRGKGGPIIEDPETSVQWEFVTRHLI